VTALLASQRADAGSHFILRVADGKFVEHWGGVADQMDDFLSQIGGA